MNIEQAIERLLIDCKIELDHCGDTYTIAVSDSTSGDDIHFDEGSDLQAILARAVEAVELDRKEVRPPFIKRQFDDDELPF